MLLRGAFLLTFLAICPAVFCRHIRSSNNEESSQSNGSQSTSGSSGTKRQLKRTHLRLHNKPPTALDAIEGDSKYLECMAGGTPAPTIHWLKDGILIPQGQTSDDQETLSSTDNAVNTKKRINVSFTMSRLYLDCLSVEDQGEYTCVAENPYHRVSASTKVTVMSSDEEIECGKKSHGQAPRINLWTKTMIGTQGEEAKFICRADGYPRPTVRWLGLEKEELTNADFDKFEILSNGDLIVRNLSWSDMGTYSCIAENVHGESKVEVFLYPTVTDQ